jgi:predicted ATPase
LSFNQNRAEDRPRIVAEKVELDGSPVLSRDVNKERLDDPLTLTQTELEQLSTNRRFRAIHEFFQSMRYSHVVPQIIRDPRRALEEKEEDPFGGDLLRRINETPKRSRDARLKRMREALAIAVPQFEDLTFEVDEAGKPHLLAAYRHWRKNPTQQREETFSDGTLRLLGLLWALGENAGPLLLEEPELSLNDAVTSQIPRMLARMQRLSGRQTLITTHSTALLNDKGIGPAEVHVLEVTDNGTEVKTGSKIKSVVNMYQSGLNMAESAMPLVRPQNIEQLSLF